MMQPWNPDTESEPDEPEDDTENPDPAQTAGRASAAHRRITHSFEFRDPWKINFEASEKKIKKSDKKLAKSVRDTELERLSQSNSLRPWFMGIALFLAAIVVCASAFMGIWLTITRQLSDPIGIGFIVTLGIEVVGIIAIIAHYLFATPASTLLGNASATGDDD